MTSTPAKHWLTVARQGCGYGCGEDGLCYQHAGIPAVPCPNEAEHQRTATLLQEQVEPLVEALRRLTREKAHIVCIIRDRADVIRVSGDDWDVTGDVAAGECSDELLVLANAIESGPHKREAVSRVLAGDPDGLHARGPK